MKTDLFLIFIVLGFLSCKKSETDDSELIPQAGLIAEYTFENSLNTSDANEVFNLNVYDRYETAIQTPDNLFVPGKFGYALNLNNETELASTNAEFQSYFDYHYSYSIVAWFKTYQPGIIFSCDNDNVYPYKRTTIVINEDGSILFERYYASTMGGTEEFGSYGFNSAKKGLNDNEWHMVVALYDGKALSLIIDNKYKESYNGNANRTSIIGSEASVESGGTKRVTIGGNVQNNWPNFNGEIDQIRIYSRVINDDEIYRLFNESDYAKNSK
jgi:hypothetical protein